MQHPYLLPEHKTYSGASPAMETQLARVLI
jgi:hypothetical protein